jgi:hypothetical protein
MKKPRKPEDNASFLERRPVAIFLNAVLFVCNFLLFYFIWLYAFPDITGLIRVALCWGGAYVLTWIMASLAKGGARLALTVVFLGIVYVVFKYQP